MSQAIFIAATGQNVGKTTLCLGLIAALQKRYSSVGFIKPVGQQHVMVDQGTIVDKDAILFREHFHLSSSWADMSPVIIPQGFTRDYLDQKVEEGELYRKIKHAFEHLAKDHPYTIVEGTGHVGVGSIINLNNAQVAKALGLDIVMIASGGLGSSYDELVLNLTLCRQVGVHVKGVILNRVLEQKREMILEYFTKALDRWNIPILGCVPYEPFLSNPTMRDFEHLFGTELLSGAKHRYRHFLHHRLVACSLDAYRQEMQQNELVITPASREDVIRAILAKQREMVQSSGEDYEGGLILTSPHPPSKKIIEEIRSEDLPVLYAPLFSYDAMKKITSFIAKIRKKDLQKIEKAIELVEKSVDLQLLCT